jgi:hypothetical protein
MVSFLIDTTFTSQIYLKPMSLPKQQPDEDFYEYGTIPDEQPQKRLSTCMREIVENIFRYN